MATLFQNFISGTLTVDPGAGGVTLTASAFTSMSTVTAPDTMWLVLDPEGVFGAPEIVLCTTHTAAAGTCTVTRAQQSTTARAHAIGTVVRVAATKSDLDELPFRKMTTTGDILYASAANTADRLAIGAATTVLHGGTTPSYSQIVAGDIASDAVTTVKVLDANITTAKILDANVTTAKIADLNVTTGKLAAGAVTPAKQTFTKCRLSKSTTLTTSFADITGWTEDDDVSGFYSSGANAVIPETGIYNIAFIGTAHASSVGFLEGNLYVNSLLITALGSSISMGALAAAGSNYAITTFLTAADTVKVQARVSNAGDTALAQSLKLILVRIG